MDTEEALFDLLLSQEIDESAKSNKKISKQILKDEHVKVRHNFGVAEYSYKNGTVTLKMDLGKNSQYHRFITHPVDSDKKNEIKKCIYDLAWLNTTLKIHLILQDLTLES